MTGALVQCGAIGTFMVLGALYARHPAQGFITRDTLLNLANGAVLFAFRAGVIAGAVGWMEIGLVDASAVASPLAQFALAFVMLDFTRYWLHRAHHRVDALWMFHRVHHMSERLDSTSGLRMHVVDFVQLAFLPVVLFGALLNTSSWARHCPWAASSTRSNTPTCGGIPTRRLDGCGAACSTTLIFTRGTTPATGQPATATTATRW